jgi:predicted O-linked N-acetylglucosamine transferase (SPINDLY family)
LAETSAIVGRAVDLHRQGKLEAAAALYRAVLESQPGHFDALHLLGVLNTQQGRHEAAVALISRALEQQPDSVEAHCNLGVALMELDRAEEALRSYDRALLADPRHAETLCNRGNALAKLGRYPDAIASYERALAVRPDHASALYGRGAALAHLQRYEEAIAAYRKALAVRPRHFHTLHNLGIALANLKRDSEALACYDQALAIAPDDATALANRANALAARRRYQEAIASYEKALERDPKLPYAAGHIAFFRAHLCDWKERDRSLAALSKEVRSGTLVSPFSLLTLSDDPALQHTRAVNYARGRWPALRPPLWNDQRYRHERVRIAYLSGDFGDHPMAHLTAGLFERHDRKRFEITAISYGPDAPGDMRNRLRAAFDHFLDVRQCGDREIAQRLRDEETDIAVDLSGYTSNGRPGILAHRPAPLQVNYLGYLGTMGAEYVDYLVADEFVIPPEHRIHYSEKVVYLPGCFQVNDSKREIATRIPTRSEAGLPELGFVFCSFNNNFKIAPPVFDVWMRLLREVGDSVLWLLETDPAAARNLREEAARRGVAPERLVFAPRAKLAGHLARQRLADLFLDTLPVNAGATASDALWAGLPVLTCAGRTFPGRMAGSLLRAVELPELITHSLRDYEATALRLATEPGRLREVRDRLERNRTAAPLFDTGRFRRHIEAAYTTMCDIHQRGERPRTFAVPLSSE